MMITLSGMLIFYNLLLTIAPYHSPRVCCNLFNPQRCWESLDNLDVLDVLRNRPRFTHVTSLYQRLVTLGRRLTIFLYLPIVTVVFTVQRAVRVKDGHRHRHKDFARFGICATRETSWDRSPNQNRLSLSLSLFLSSLRPVSIRQFCVKSPCHNTVQCGDQSYDHDAQ